MRVAAELEVGLRGRREPDLDLLEAHLDERLEHAPLALVVHRVDERLVAVAKVDAAPHGRVGDDPARPLPVRQVDGCEGPVLLDGHPAARLGGRPCGGPGSLAGRSRFAHFLVPPKRKKPALVSGGGLRNDSLSAALRSGRPPPGPGKSEEREPCLHAGHARRADLSRQPLRSTIGACGEGRSRGAFRVRGTSSVRSASGEIRLGSAIRHEASSELRAGSRVPPLKGNARISSANQTRRAKWPRTTLSQCGGSSSRVSSTQ